MPQPCEICGAERADAHHDDYRRKLQVRWLCRTHHLRFHAGHNDPRGHAAPPSQLGGVSEKKRKKILHAYRRTVAHTLKANLDAKVNLTMIARRVDVNVSVVSRVIDEAKRRGEL